jgi:hypothetical protein
MGRVTNFAGPFAPGSPQNGFDRGRGGAVPDVEQRQSEERSGLKAFDLVESDGGEYDAFDHEWPDDGFEGSRPERQADEQACTVWHGSYREPHAFESSPLMLLDPVESGLGCGHEEAP